ncbi:MAG: hypothetical protein ACKVVP_20310 [Chloroflexota bacterium]
MAQANSTDLEILQKGALVLGTDLEIGTLESVKQAEGSEPATLIVRHGHAESLLSIPADAIKNAEPTRIHLNLRREDAEVLIFHGGADGGSTTASPSVDEVIGAPDPTQPDGPSTG